MKILYGVLSHNIDVTQICYDKLLNNYIITIPISDSLREYYFTDPVPTVLKNIIIIDEDNKIIEYVNTLELQINVLSNKITTTTTKHTIPVISSKLRILYGIFNNNIDVTQICYDKLLNNDIITIPSGDHIRDSYFTDPVPTVLKNIIIIDEDNKFYEYVNTLELQINVLSNKITTTSSKHQEISSKLRILYGILSNNIDVTQFCYDKLLNNDIITIPSGDHRRDLYFTDPVPTVLKNIIIIDEDNKFYEYVNTLELQINVLNNKITTTASKHPEISSKLKIKYGGFYEELPEQLMVIDFLTGNEKVLEIGGNIGRNTLIIGSILTESNNLVSLECDPESARKLCENRDLNNMNFHIENSALSKRQLIQKEWDTIVSDTILDGYKKVNTITLEELNNKYNITFDTLVLDCEGSFYYILMDMPEILNNINLIIMENDYHNYQHKLYIDYILKQNNFYVVYSEPGGWGQCYNNFYETWKRKLTSHATDVDGNI